MRFINVFFAFIFLIFFPRYSVAAVLWTVPGYSGCTGLSSAAAAGACAAPVLNTGTTVTYMYTSVNVWSSSQADLRFTKGGTGSGIFTLGATYSGTCNAGTVWSASLGMCMPICTITGQVNNSTTGMCECPSGSEVVSGQCLAVCAANQIRNLVTNVCEGPCTQAQYDSAVADLSTLQDKVSVTQGQIGGGLRVVNEYDTVSYQCTNTCRVKKHFQNKIGNITNTSYEMKDWTHYDVEHTGCDVMPTGTSTSTGVEIGRASDGGCKPGFAYGEVNGTAGCYGSPSSGASDGSGGGGPQNHPDNPGGSDGAGNGPTGQNQNGSGGACNAGYHDAGGTCVRDTNISGGSGGDDGSGVPAATYGGTDYSTWFDTAEIDGQIEQGKVDLKTQFENFRQSISSGMSLAGSPSLPDFGSATVLGRTISFDLNRYSQPLSLIAQALLVASLVISAYIVLKR